MIRALLLVAVLSSPVLAQTAQDWKDAQNQFLLDKAAGLGRGTINAIEDLRALSAEARFWASVLKTDGDFQTAASAFRNVDLGAGRFNRERSNQFGLDSVKERIEEHVLRHVDPPEPTPASILKVEAAASLGEREDFLARLESLTGLVNEATIFYGEEMIKHMQAANRTSSDAVAFGERLMLVMPGLTKDSPQVQRFLLTIPKNSARIGDDGRRIKKIQELLQRVKTQPHLP